MQFTVQELGGLKRQLTGHLSAAIITQDVDKALKKMAPSIKLDGFRPGKVPFSVVRQRYETSVRHDAIERHIREQFFDAVKEKSLNPAGMPHVHFTQDNVETDVKYTATFEVWPKVALSKTNKIKVERWKAEITDADIEKAIEKFRAQRPELEEGLNDESLKKVGFSRGLEAFREEVRKSLESQATQLSKNITQKQLFDQLLTLNPCEVPEVAIQGEIEEQKRQLLAMMQSSHSASKVEQQLPDELFKEQATRRVKLGMICSQAIADRKIEATPEQLDALLDDMSQSYADASGFKQWYTQDKQRMSQLKSKAREEQFVEQLLNEAQIKEKSGSFDDLIKANQDTQGESTQGD